MSQPLVVRIICAATPVLGQFRILPVVPLVAIFLNIVVPGGYYRTAASLFLVAKPDRGHTPTDHLCRLGGWLSTWIRIYPACLQNLGNSVPTCSKVGDGYIAILAGSDCPGIASRIGDGELPT